MSGSDLPSKSNTSRGLGARVEAVRFLLDYVGARKTALLAFCLILTSLSEGFGLLLLVPVTQVIIGNVGDSSEVAWLDALTGIDPGALLAIVVALICVRAGLVFATNQLRTDIDLSLVRELREAAYSALVRAEWRWLSGRHSAEHEALLLGEAGRVGSMIDHGLFLVSASLTLVVLVGSAMLISPLLTLGVLAAAAAIALPILLSKGRSARDAEAYADAYEELHRQVSGGVAHLRSAKIAGAGSMLEDRLSFASGDLRASELRYVRQGHILVALIQALAAVMLAGLVYIALVQGDVALSVFVPLLALLARAAPLAGTIAQGFRQWNHAQPALMRLRAFIAEANANAECGVQAADLEPFTLQKSLELREVGLRFEEREDAVFSALSCSIPAGEITAVLGPSGSGKSCLADLVSGLLEPDAGEVWVDGVALDGERRFVWRESVAYAEQSPYLFSASVADNVAWASPAASREQIEAALAAASAHFVARLASGMDTPVLEQGRGLSGGERQRIGLARALLRKPKLLILDEVTASLDRANRQTIRDSVAGLRGTCTVLILTHDEELAELADHVIDLAQIASSDNG